MSELIVIGGGISGLVAGICARKAGFSVTVLEKHAVAGGNLTGWNRQGYHIDNCIHWLTGTNRSTDLHRLWKEIGMIGEEGTVSHETLFTCFYGGESFSLPRDLKTLGNAMLLRSPQDAREIRLLLKAIDAVQGMSGVSGEKHDRKHSLLRTARTLPLLARYRAMTTGELAARFKDPLLNRFLSSFLTDSFGALGLLAVFAHFCGGNADLPKGGSFRAAERVAEKFRSLGGVLRTSAEVVDVEKENGRVKAVVLKNGERIPCDQLLISVDPAVAFPRLLHEKMPDGLACRYRNKRLLRFSSVQAAFSCAVDDLPFSGEAVLPLFSPLSEYLVGSALLVREFSHERSFAPPGRTVVQTMVFCSETEAKGWIALQKNPARYAEEKDKTIRRVLGEIGKVFPSLVGKLQLLDCWTPATYRRFVGSDIGSYMSFAFSSRILPSRLSPRIPRLKNAFLCGQWLQAPGGLPIAARTGVVAAERAARADKKTFSLPFRAHFARMSPGKDELK